MALKKITITVTNIKEEVAEELQHFFIEKTKNAGIKPAIKITNMGKATASKKTHGRTK